LGEGSEVDLQRILLVADSGVDKAAKNNDHNLKDGNAAAGTVGGSFGH